jgi:HD superfamily phosphodiesterase
MTHAWLLDRYIPERAWFERQASQHYAGTHGIGHITRVLVWTAQIAERLNTTLRREELFWAAGLHDIKRWDDGRDQEHGERAAGWVLAEFANVRPDIARSLDLELIADLCRGHVISNDLFDRWSPELQVLKDADGLERVRIFDLDPGRLRLRDITPALEPPAWQLMQLSQARGDDADAVRHVALELGLWH